MKDGKLKHCENITSFGDWAKKSQLNITPNKHLRLRTLMDCFPGNPLAYFNQGILLLI